MFAAFKSMNAYEWALVAALLLATVCILIFLFSDKTSYGFMEEGFVDSTSPGPGETAFQKPIDLSNLNELTDESTSADVKLLLVQDDQCPHCRNFKATWENLANKYNGTRLGDRSVRFFQVGSNNGPLRHQIEQAYDVRGYPTILVFKDNRVNEYTQERDYSSMATYIETECGTS